MFNCNDLRNDIIDFYDISKNKFEKEIIKEIIYLASSGLLLYIDQYF